MKYLSAFIFVMFIFCPQAFAAGNLDKINGTWECDVERTVAVMAKFDPDNPVDAEELALNAKDFLIKFDAQAKTVSFQESRESTHEFSVVSDRGNILVITLDDDEVAFEFLNKDSMVMTVVDEFSIAFKRANE